MLQFTGKCHRAQEIITQPRYGGGELHLCKETVWGTAFSPYFLAITIPLSYHVDTTKEGRLPVASCQGPCVKTASPNLQMLPLFPCHPHKEVAMKGLFLGCSQTKSSVGWLQETKMEFWEQLHEEQSCTQYHGSSFSFIHVHVSNTCLWSVREYTYKEVVKILSIVLC